MQSDKGIRLYQPATGSYWTEAMETFARGMLDNVGELDGAILKSRSPSCGVKDVKVYPAKSEGVPAREGTGVFARVVRERLPRLPLEDEGRLTNHAIRECFLTRIYASAAFREVRRDGAAAALTRFQAENKFLVMAYSETAMRELGRIAANHERLPIQDVLAAYAQVLSVAFAEPARPSASVNVLQHVFGFFSDKLSSAEKALFLDCLEDYRQARAPLSVPVSVLRAWVVRFDNAYLRDQTLFEPYPEDLVQIADSGKGRTLSYTDRRMKPT